jgi:hypothetical protein
MRELTQQEIQAAAGGCLLLDSCTQFFNALFGIGSCAPKSCTTTPPSGSGSSTTTPS